MTVEGDGAGGRDRWRLVPIVGWIRSYQRRWLRGDLIAGFAVAALIVPKNLGYAGIAGIPLQNGLYAAAAGAILYPIFGTSRQISTGPSSGLAAVAASAVAVAGITGTDDVASFVALMTLASGALFLVLAVLRMGWIAQFLSRAVVTGFLFGAAIDVVIGELPKLTGTEASGSNSLRELGSWFRTLGDTQLATVVVGAAALAVVFGLRFVAPAIPGALVLVVGGLLASRLFDLAARGVALVGDVPRGLPTFEVPDTEALGDHAGTVAVAAVALVLIGFSQTAGDSRTFAARHRYRIDINQESVAQGMANVGAGLVQGMPVSTSLSASSLNDHTRSTNGPRLDHLRRDRPPHPPLPRAAVLGPAQAGARGVDHRGRGDGDDGRPRDAPPPPGAALRLLDRGGGHRRDPPAGCARRGDGRDRAVVDLADLGGDTSPDAAVGAGSGDAVLPRAGREPGRRAVPGPGGAPAGRRPVLRHLRRPRGPRPGGRLVDAGRDLPVRRRWRRRARRRAGATTILAGKRSVSGFSSSWRR